MYPALRKAETRDRTFPSAIRRATAFNMPLCGMLSKQPPMSPSITHETRGYIRATSRSAVCGLCPWRNPCEHGRKSASNPRSRGYGRRERILPRCGSLIPGIVNTHGLTHDPVIILEAMDQQEGCLVHGEVDKGHWRKEGNHYGRCRRGRRPFVAGERLIRGGEREPDLPLEHRIHQEA